jgi:hypothetical protein
VSRERDLRPRVRAARELAGYGSQVPRVFKPRQMRSPNGPIWRLLSQQDVCDFELSSNITANVAVVRMANCAYPKLGRLVLYVALL